MSDNEPSASKASDEETKNNTTSDIPHNMDNLEERFSQQQEIISQLKEMVLAEETARTEKIASTRLKMEKYVSQLAKIRDRAKHKRKPSSDNSKGSDSFVCEQKSVDTPDTSLNESKSLEVDDSSTSSNFSPPPDKPRVTNREVTKLLHEQIKERKAKIAERTKNDKELEKALMKIQKQLEENQSQSAETIQITQSKIPLSDSPHLIENVESKVVIELKNRIAQLEGNVLDLQETCKEKDNVIKSKTEAITLMSADLSKKGKKTLDLLDDTKIQMQKMQENFANMENNMKMEKQSLYNELEVCKNKITYLEEANTILESERFKLSIENTSLEEKIMNKDVEIHNINCLLQEKANELQEFTSQLSSVSEIDKNEEKGIVETSEMIALSEKIEIMEKLNCSLRQSNIELQEKINSFSVDQSKSSPSRSKSKPNRNSSKEKSGKLKIHGDEKINYTENIKKLEVVINSLNKQILENEIFCSQKDVEIKNLKDLLEVQKEFERSENKENETVSLSTICPVSSSAVKDDVVIETTNDIIGGIQDPNIDSLKDQLEDALKQIEKLSKELSESNKSMIKLKATHKNKIKQMQKSIDDFSKVSHSNSEVVRLQSEVNSLTQKITELEDDKGNLQLHLVDYDSGKVSDSQLHAKMIDLENVAEERLKAIADLEMQKFDLVQELHIVKQKVNSLEDKIADLSFLENEHVSSEIKQAQVEEQLDLIKVENNNILKQIEHLHLEKSSLVLNVESLTKEKNEINNKLDYYIQENMELIDRLEKLSAEKVSSAESIEMVESLTSQEKMEIEQYQKNYNISQHDKDAEENKDDDNFPKDELLKSNLQPKIDIYSQEHCEVIDKLENLQSTNNEITLQLEKLNKDKNHLLEKHESIIKEKDDILNQHKHNEEKISELNSKIDELLCENKILTEKLHNNPTPIRTEIIVSETVEVVDTIEKELIEYPGKKEVSDQNLEIKDNVIESTKSGSKGDKKFTKEILRLKNTLKHKESEISELNLKLSESVEIFQINDTLKNDISVLNIKLQEIMDENLSLNNCLAILQDNKNSTNSLDKDLSKFDELLELKNSLSDDLIVKESHIRMLEEKIITKDTEISNIKKDYIEIENKFESQNEKVLFYLDQKIILLQKIIQQNEGEISNIHSELYDSIDNSDKYTYYINNLDIQIKNIVELIENKKISIVNLTEEKNDNIKKINELMKECLQKDELISIQNEKISEIQENHNHNYSESIAHYEFDIVSLKEKCSIYEDDQTKQKEKYNLLQQDNKSLEIKLEEIEGKLNQESDLNSKLNTVISELSNNLQNESLKNSIIENNYTELQAENSSLKSKCDFIENELAQTNFSKNELENEFKQMQTYANELSLQKENLLKIVDSSKIEAENLFCQNNDLNGKISEYENQISILNEENKSNYNTINDLKNDIKNNENTLLKISELEEQVIHKQAEIKILLNKLEDLQNIYNETCSAHEAKIQETEVYIESLQTDLSKYKDKIIRLEETLLAMESLEKKANNLVVKLEEKDLAFSESQQHEDDLNKKLIALTAQDKLIQKQLIEIKHENTELHEKINAFNDSKKHLQNELEFSKSELINLRDKLSNLELISQERCMLLERCTLLESQLRDLSLDYSDKLKVKTNECEYLDSILQSQNENFDTQIKQSKEHCKRLQEENNIKTNTINYMEAENERLQAEIEILNSDKTNVAQVEVSMPLFKFEDSDSKSNENLLNNEKANLQIEIAHLSNLLKEKEKNILQLQEEIFSIKANQSPLNETITSRTTKVSYSSSPSHLHQINFDQNQELNLKSIEDQILSTDNIHTEDISNVETPMIRSFCHDPPIPISSAQLISKEEEKIKPKEAYQCFKSNTAISKTFIQHEQSVSNESLSKEIFELNNSIEILKEEKEKINSDFIASQQKTNKALLKLKEYKLRYDSLNSELKKLKSSSVVSDLDTAIHDELSSQITKLEEKVKEMVTLSEKEKIEKENLFKRIDILTSANERLFEMKEKQDLEMEVVKAKNLSLNEKVKNLQWSDDFTVEEEETETNLKDAKYETYEKSIMELNIKLSDLESDNENLQIALDEQKNKFELLIQNEKKAIIKNSDSIEEYKKENENVKKLLDESLEEKKNIIAAFEITSKENNDFKVMLNESSNIIAQNNILMESLKSENVELKTKITALIEEYSGFQEKFKTLSDQRDKLEEDFTTISKRIIDLENENEKIFNECSNYKNQVSKIQYEKDEISEKINPLREKLLELNQNKENLEHDLHQSNSKNSDLQFIISGLENKIDTTLNNFNTCENTKIKLEQQIFELQRCLADCANKDSIENSHEICTSQINDLTLTLNDTKKKLSEITVEKEEFKCHMESQLSEKIQNYNTLSNEYTNLKDILSKKDNEIIDANKQLFELRESLMQHQTNQLELHKIIQLKDNDLQNFSNFNEACSTKFAEYELICNAKDSELMEKSQEIQLLKQSLSGYDNLVHQLTDLETKLSDVTHEKDAELADLRLKMHAEKIFYDSTTSDLYNKIQDLEQQLQAKHEECKCLNAKLEELQTLIDEEATQMTEMRAALENQEIEIVTLKENLTAHAEAYEKLNKAYIKSGKHVTFSEDTNFNDDTVNTNRENQSSSSPRADLDLALYMLHQRDVRCEELTIELMQLLEERDTLQLKLSNAIRTNEDLRSKVLENQIESRVANPLDSDDSNILTTKINTSQIIENENSPSSNLEKIATNETTPNSSLENKISELHSVSHLRDIRLKDERESRQRQMELFQRDIQNLPPEAAAQLREAHYTLSRDTQSASTVLFNWLWGRTTPKVVHM